MHSFVYNFGLQTPSTVTIRVIMAEGGNGGYAQRQAWARECARKHALLTGQGHGHGLNYAQMKFQLSKVTSSISPSHHVTSPSVEKIKKKLEHGYQL